MNRKEETFMAYKIGDDCISCGSCAATCPVEAISEGSEHYEIDPDKCVECGSCAAGCPVSAISAPRSCLKGQGSKPLLTGRTGQEGHF